MKVFKNFKLITHFIITLVVIFSALNTSAHAADKFSLDGIKKMFNSPIGVIVISGVGLVYSGILYKGAAEQEEEAKKNIEEIDKIIATFQDSYGAFCPQGRNDLKQAECYCYTDKGAKNEGRSNSKVCQDLWAKNDYKLAADATDYRGQQANTNPTGCVKIDNTFDEDCKCRKLINANGENACKKSISFTNITDGYSPSMAASTNLKDLEKMANEITQGNGSLNGIDLSALTKKAIQNRNLANQLRTKLNNERQENIPFFDEKNSAVFAKALIGEENFNNPQGGVLNSLASSTATGNGNLDTAIVAAKKKHPTLGLTGTGSGLANKNRDGKSSGMDFGMFESTGDSSSAGVIAGFEDGPRYNYKNSDINTNEEVSIFEVINNRYVQSGLKRLFDETPTAEEKNN